jgi:hypothetical protein
MKHKLIATLVAGTMAFAVQAEETKDSSVVEGYVINVDKPSLAKRAMRAVFGEKKVEDVFYSGDPLSVDESLNDRFSNNSESIAYDKMILNIEKERLGKKIDVANKEISKILIDLDKYDIESSSYRVLVGMFAVENTKNIENISHFGKINKTLKSINAYDPNVDFASIYEASISASDHESIEKMEAYLTSLKIKGDQSFVDGNGVEYSTSFSTINTMNQQAGIAARHVDYFDNKYHQFLISNIDVQWSVQVTPTQVNLHKNHALYDMKFLDLQTGMENYESMQVGRAMAKNGYPIEVCAFYEGSKSYYEFTQDQLATMSEWAENYEFSCIDEEKVHYFNERLKDFSGVLGHWIVPK